MPQQRSLTTARLGVRLWSVVALVVAGLSVSATVSTAAADDEQTVYFADSAFTNPASGVLPAGASAWATQALPSAAFAVVLLVVRRRFRGQQV